MKDLGGKWSLEDIRKILNRHFHYSITFQTWLLLKWSIVYCCYCNSCVIITVFILFHTLIMTRTPKLYLLQRNYLLFILLENSRCAMQLLPKRIFCGINVQSFTSIYLLFCIYGWNKYAAVLLIIIRTINNLHKKGYFSYKKQTCKRIATSSRLKDNDINKLCNILQIN